MQIMNISLHHLHFLVLHLHISRMESNCFTLRKTCQSGCDEFYNGYSLR